jgi:NAD(P)H dehydrogenase (quinone)
MTALPATWAGASQRCCLNVAFPVSGYAESGKRAEVDRNVFEAAAGVRHIVYLSFTGASPHSLFPMSRDHFLSERHLLATGVPNTILRDSFYLDLIPEMLPENWHV